MIVSPHQGEDSLWLVHLPWTKSTQTHNEHKLSSISSPSYQAGLWKLWAGTGFYKTAASEVCVPKVSLTH